MESSNKSMPGISFRSCWAVAAMAGFLVETIAFETWNSQLRAPAPDVGCFYYWSINHIQIWRFPRFPHPQMDGLYGTIPLKWMRTGGTPMTQETSIYSPQSPKAMGLLANSTGQLRCSRLLSRCHGGPGRGGEACAAAPSGFGGQPQII